MTTHDDRVERIARAMYANRSYGHGWDADDAMPPGVRVTDVYREDARAALAAMDAEPLEDVLGSVPWLAWLDVQWVEDEVSPEGEFYAEAGGFDGRYRGGEGAGPTIADAIRNAVAAAKSAKEAT